MLIIFLFISWVKIINNRIKIKFRLHKNSYSSRYKINNKVNRYVVQGSRLKIFKAVIVKINKIYRLILAQRIAMQLFRLFKILVQIITEITIYEIL
jgi:hypothetical protein